MDNEAELRIKGITENIGLARVTVASFASQLNFTISELEELKVAISEAVSNAIIHGYQHRTGEVTLKLKINGNQLEVVVVDEGVGIEDIDSAFQPSYTTEDRMGLGLTFIKSFMDNLKIDSTPGEGTKVKMVKKPVQNTAQAD